MVCFIDLVGLFFGRLRKTRVFGIGGGDGSKVIPLPHMPSLASG